MNRPMQTQLDCLPCFLRQALDAARQATTDEERQRIMLYRISHALPLLDVRRSPPAAAQQVHRIIRATIGGDPYRAVKDRMNRLGLKLRQRLRPAVQAAPDPFEAAARIAIAANCIDFGARSPVSLTFGSLHRSGVGDTLARFRRGLARSIRPGARPSLPGRQCWRDRPRPSSHRPTAARRGYRGRTRSRGDQRRNAARRSLRGLG